MNKNNDQSRGVDAAQETGTASRESARGTASVSNTGVPPRRPIGRGGTRRRNVKIIRVIGILLATLALAASIYGLMKSNQRAALARDEQQSRDSVLRQLATQAEGINGLREDLKNFKAEMAIAPDPGVDVSAKIGQLNDTVAKLQASVGKVEAVILEDPAKAVAIPLLRKDLESYKATEQDHHAATRLELDRLYDMNKWLFGIIVTLSLGVLGAVIGTFFKQAGADADEDDEAVSTPVIVGGSEEA